MTTFGALFDCRQFKLKRYEVSSLYRGRKRERKSDLYGDVIQALDLDKGSWTMILSKAIQVTADRQITDWIQGNFFS